MKPGVIEIDSFSSAVPKYKTWYKYHDTLWVSVIYADKKRKSHLRRKTEPSFNTNKNDKEMCQWHWDWQFQKIETEYGIAVSGIKTYEIGINHKGEIHRIDSVVQDVAIEFQHTLTVSLNEMDSRYTAHGETGFKPYLVLDFSEYTAVETIGKYRSFDHRRIEAYINNDRNECIVSFLKKLRKWLNSKYFINSCLFLDFSDRIVRFTPDIKDKKYLDYSQSDFVHRLTELDVDIQLEKERIKQQEDQLTREKHEKSILDFERKKSEYQELVRANKFAVENGEDFKNYRKCLKHGLIRQCINSVEYLEIITYRARSIVSNGIYKKYHIYSLFQQNSSTPEVEVQYITNSKKDGADYSYLYSDINIIKNHERGLKVFSFTLKPKSRITLTSKRLEFVRGCLHSTSSQALYIYDANEVLIKKLHYLFNMEVSEDEFNELAFYYENGVDIDGAIKKNEKLINLIEKKDKHELIKYFCQNYTPSNVLSKYYDEIEDIQPLEERNKWNPELSFSQF